MTNNNYQGENWNGKIGSNELLDFLEKSVITGMNLRKDFQFLKKNEEALQSGNFCEPMVRLGATLERYENEIAVYEAMLSVKCFLIEKYAGNQNYGRIINNFPLYNEWQVINVERNNHVKNLEFHTTNIPIYIAIKTGAKGIDWILDKMGQEVKNIYHRNYRYSEHVSVFKLQKAN